MAQVWRCDRCNAISELGNVDEAPDGWGHYEMPVRGNEGARSRANVVLCGPCEDSLYAWLYAKTGTNPQPPSVEGSQAERAHNAEGNTSL